jgi:uncharacterized protein YbjT (DUF2867 family)
MKIVVIGGSGLIGSNLTDKLRQLGHTVIAASPSSGVNTITGEGLNEVLKGADVVVDVSNSPSFEAKAVMDFFKTSTTNLLTATKNADVKHYVALSVVGTDRLPGSPYLRAKFEQEELISKSGGAYSILRSTQFFEFAAAIAKAGSNGNEVHISTGSIQPIASNETVAALTDVVVSEPLNAIVEVGGPERMPMSEFIRYYLNATEDSRQLVPDDHALYFGVELNEDALDALVPGENARRGKIRFEEWFNTQLVKA